MDNRILEGIEPESVFRFFEEICGIPHGSSDTKKISDYLKNFGESRNLRTIQDAANNVIIFKDGSKGCENCGPVILQGHMDMVCEREADKVIDFEKDGLSLVVENGYVTADGTTLGADDGIAVAIMLAILDSNELTHPPIEAVFTVDEEIGMLGANALDMSVLKGKHMINIDNEEEGYLLSACAGGATVSCSIDVNRTEVAGTLLNISVSGLTGGHSGQEIDKYRANASVLMARMLYGLKKKWNFNLISVNGGLKDNAIARSAKADIILENCDENEIQNVMKFISQFQNIFSSEYAFSDPELKVEADYKIEQKADAMSSECSSKVIGMLYSLPSGIQKMCHEMPEQVQTSLNLGILKTTFETAKASHCVRSSKSSEKQEVIDRLTCITESYGGYVDVKGEYPAWEFVSKCELRDSMVRIFEEMFGKTPVVYSIHAGVECGLFSDRIKGLQCVSIGPDIKDIHTPQEALSIASTERTYKYILKVLESLSESLK